ncbi:MAG: hypothetical protein MJB14_02875 [Spirochaetes bacterium]|nr:hypothetical protein [Spirochaetota bacterium]
MTIDIITDGLSAGRTFESETGYPIDVAISADQREVEELFLRSFQK